MFLFDGVLLLRSRWDVHVAVVGLEFLCIQNIDEKPLNVELINGHSFFCNNINTTYSKKSFYLSVLYLSALLHNISKP